MPVHAGLLHYQGALELLGVEERSRTAWLAQAAAAGFDVRDQVQHHVRTAERPAPE